MADTVSATSSAMSNAEANFKNRVEEFETASQNILNAVNELASTWKGNGYQSFTAAMGKWHTDLRFSTFLSTLSRMMPHVNCSQENVPLRIIPVTI